jgi:phage FluMu protein Com
MTCDFCKKILVDNEIKYSGGVFGYSKWISCDRCKEIGISQDNFTLSLTDTTYDPRTS